METVWSERVARGLLRADWTRRSPGSVGRAPPEDGEGIDGFETFEPRIAEDRVAGNAHVRTGRCRIALEVKAVVQRDDASPVDERRPGLPFDAQGVMELGGVDEDEV